LSRTASTGHTRREAGSQSQGTGASAQASLVASAGLLLETPRGKRTTAVHHLSARRKDSTVLARIRKTQEENEGGFTLIELLVVIIIIGILAAIAIPTFLNQRKKGWDAASKSELRNAAVAQESYAIEASGTYASSSAVLKVEGFNQSGPFTSPGTFTYTLTGGGTAYCMQASHKSQPTVFWKLDSAVGEPVKGTCTA
jgi:type IV pilus assembly protein PilA